jgi:peptidoglycan/LPS O-acetylase OafA/YrhL
MEGFFVGSLVYVVFQRLPRARVPRKDRATALELVALALAGVFLTYADETTPLALLGPLVFGVVVLVFAFEGGTISRLLQRRAFVMAGALSYSIYLTHTFVYIWLSRGYHFFGHRWGIATWIRTDGLYRGNVWMADLMTVVAVALVVAMSALTYRFVEVPGRETFNRAARRREGPAPEPLAVCET